MDNHGIIEDALDKHYPESDISVYCVQNMVNKFHIGITQQEIDFTLFIDNNFLQNIQSKADCFDNVQKLSNFNVPTKEQLTPVNLFIQDLYTTGTFNKIFEPFPLISTETMYKVDEMKDLNFTIIHNLSDPSISRCRIDKQNYFILLNCYFKMTKNRELLAVPTLSFFCGKENQFKFDVSFNLETDTVHLVNSHPIYYEEFFEENSIFDVKKDFDSILKQFIDKNVMKKIDPTDELKRQLDSLGDDIDTKIKLLLMYSI